MLLAQDVEQNQAVVAEFERILLSSCKIKVPPAKKPKGRNTTVKSFSQRVKQARSSFPLSPVALAPPLLTVGWRTFDAG
jgi:hypothetical protein